MKKKLTIGLVLALVITLIPASAVSAADPAEVDISWDGSGWVGGDVDTGDAEAGFGTAGDDISGSYSAKDFNDNPYNYGVDSFSAYLDAYVEDGYIEAGSERTDSYAGMYGNDGQESYSFVGVEGGSASMAYRTTTNFAAMKDCSYTYQLAGGHNIVVNDAEYYELVRAIDDGRGNSGFVYADGDGSATLDCMSAEASGCWTLKLGRGCGCYTDASFSATGTSGYFEVSGTGNNNVTFHGLGVSSGGGTLSFIANWTNSFSVADYSLSAN